MKNQTEQLLNIKKKLHKTYGGDRHRFFRDFASLSRQISSDETKNFSKRIMMFETKVDASIEKKKLRKKNIPEIVYNDELPVSERKKEIIDKIKNNQVIILAGETGSGKTTQIPKLCLDAGRGVDGKIACTQPRRIAAVSVCERIAEELGQIPGEGVGYKIRFHDKTSTNDYIKIMTDGVLLAEAQKDPWLNDYDTIIVDEAHERSLNIDFIIGILRGLVKKRKNLKVIITSATIDTEKFSKAFNDAPVIQVTGRTYPVEVIYEPLNTDEETEQVSWVEGAASAVEDLSIMGDVYGDILVFMPTEADIRATCEMIKGKNIKGAKVLPLYARLSSAEQKKIFQPANGRKIIVSTNVAETSLTIPGIKYVVDSGTARIPVYTPRTRTTALPVINISKSSADQRKGRCGRIENGVCIRLYDEENYLSRPLFTSPEIVRANLAEVILRMISLKLGDIYQFPFIDPPSPSSINDGFKTLIELGAIKEKYYRKGPKKKKGYALTGNGKIMSEIPVDPKLSRMIIEAAERDCVEEIIVIISALSIKDPRERPADKEQHADQQHAAFKDPLSDFITLLNIWKAYKSYMKGSKKLGKLKKFCKENFLSFLRMREWEDIFNQLKMTVKESGLKITKPLESKNTKTNNKKEKFSEKYASVHKSILSGYLSGISIKKEKNIYSAAMGKEVMIFPGSGLFNKGPDWMVTSEFVETSRLFARNSAAIDPMWLEEIGKDLCKYSWTNARWDRKKGSVTATEQVTLFGLIIVPSRTVLYGNINPDEAAKIFIRDCLIEGNLDLEKLPSELSFISHNLQLSKNVKDIEARLRRKDIFIDEENIVEFYSERIKSIFDLRTLASFIKKNGGDSFLKMKEEDLYSYLPSPEELNLFPETVNTSEGELKFKYKFSPGEENDGVTIKVPASRSANLVNEKFDWIVPGLIKEKLEALIKGLPKEYRKRLVPVSNTVNMAVKEMPELKSLGSGEWSLPSNDIITALSGFIKMKFKFSIPADAWNTDNLPEHLKVKFAVTSPDGKQIAYGSDKSILNIKENIRTENSDIKALKQKWELDYIDIKNFPDIPEIIPNEKGKEPPFMYPAIVKEKDKFALRLFIKKVQAEAEHKEGIQELFINKFSKEVKALRKDLKLTGSAAKLAAYFGDDKKLSASMEYNVLKDVFYKNILTKKDFEDKCASSSQEIYKTGKEILSTTIDILNDFHKVRTIIFNHETSYKHAAPALKLSEELRSSLNSLVPENFLKIYAKDKLIHIDRYVKALAIRAERAFDNPDKDREKLKQITPFASKLKSLIENLSPETSSEKKAKIEEFFWMIEEYKVSVFAQEIKRPYKISKKRLKKQIDEIDGII